MTRRVASKLSLINMKRMPSKFRLTSPYDASAVPTAISSTAVISLLLGVSNPATKTATIVTMGVNACNIASMYTYICSCPESIGAEMHAGLEHLDEGDGEVEVDNIAEVEGEGHEQADGQDTCRPEPPCQLPLDLYPPQHLRLCLTFWPTAMARSTKQ